MVSKEIFGENAHTTAAVFTTAGNDRGSCTPVLATPNATSDGIVARRRLLLDEDHWRSVT